MDKIVFEGKKRYYWEDLSQRDYFLENTTPYRLFLFDYTIEESSWGELLRSVSAILLEHYPAKREGLLSFKCTWSKQLMFRIEPCKNHKKIDDNLYINCNHTALHSCWFLQDLLDFFDVDKSKVNFLIHRPSGAESDSTKVIILNHFKEEFTQFIIYSYGKTSDYANKVINNIDKYLNPILKRISKSYVSFFLFDDYCIYINYSKKVKEIIETNVKIPQKTKEIFYKYLQYLSDYYKL